MNLAVLFPLLILAVAAMAALLLAAFARRHLWVAAAGVAGLVLFLLSLPLVPEPLPRLASSLLVVDGFALFYWGLIGLTTLVVMLFCYSHFEIQEQPPAAQSEAGHNRNPEPAVSDQPPESPEELYGLLLLAALGACVLAASRHFLSLFLGLELVSLSLFILIAYRCRFAMPVEAGIKYLVLSGLATGLLLFGIALVYTYSGTLTFEGLATLPPSTIARSYWFGGMAMIMAGLAFKLSLVPFHFWTPDVYQGASAPITAFLATVSKAAVLAVLLRLALDMELVVGSPTWSALAGMAGGSMLIGNWLALRQGNLKRLLAYSSIAHMGYALAALLAAGPLAVEAVSFYLAFYMVTTLGAFGVIVALGHNSRGAEFEPDDRQDIQGLFWRQPLVAVVMTLMMLSLAGIPLTAGFFGKFYVLMAGADAGLWRLMFLVIVGSAVGLYYYLRVILAMLERGEEQHTKATATSIGRLNLTCLGVLTLATLWLGIYPEPLMAVVRGVAGV